MQLWQGMLPPYSRWKRPVCTEAYDAIKLAQAKNARGIFPTSGRAPRGGTSRHLHDIVSPPICSMPNVTQKEACSPGSSSQAPAKPCQAAALPDSSSLGPAPPCHASSLSPAWQQQPSPCHTLPCCHTSAACPSPVEHGHHLVVPPTDQQAVAVNLHEDVLILVQGGHHVACQGWALCLQGRV